MAYDPQADLIALATIKAAQDALNTEKAAVETRLMTYLNSKGLPKVNADLGGESIQGTVVAPIRVTIDAEQIKAALDTRQWNKVSTRVLDKEKLEAAVVQGTVPAEVVAKCSEETPTKPYVKVSTKAKGTLFPPVSIDAGVAHVVQAPRPAARKRVVKPARAKAGS